MQHANRGWSAWICRQDSCHLHTGICKISLKKLMFPFSVEQGTPVGCFSRPDALNAILELIKDALLWNLDDPVYIGLSHTSLADQHGQQILAFFKTLPKHSSRKPAVQIEVNGVFTLLWMQWMSCALLSYIWFYLQVLISGTLQTRIISEAIMKGVDIFSNS